MICMAFHDGLRKKLKEWLPKHNHVLEPNGVKTAAESVPAPLAPVLGAVFNMFDDKATHFQTIIGCNEGCEA